MKKGLLVVISGPSGAGKGSIYKRVIEETGMRRSVSVTTRAPRAGEVDGVDYIFCSEYKYQQMVAAGDFLETAEVYNHYYGTPKAPVFENLENGHDVLFEVDVHGARSIKRKYPEAILIFVMTPDFESLRDRLRARGSENEQSLNIRLNSAKSELSKYDMFNYIVFNDDLEKAVSQVLSIIEAEKHTIGKNVDAIKKLLDEQK